MTKTKAAPAAASMPADGMVEGYAATFDRIPDAYGDVIKQGAFADTLKAWEENGKPIPLLYGHSTEDPAYNIGKVVEAHEDGKGLYVVAEFDEENEKAQYVRKLVKEGRLWQFSFAYEVLDGGSVELEDGTEAYTLCGVVKEGIAQSEDYALLLEGYATVSVLNFGMTDRAQTQSLKFCE